MKHTKIKTNHGLTIIIVFIFLFGIVIYLVRNTNKTYAPETNYIVNTEEKTKIFHSSSVMRFSIALPATYRVEEKFAKVTISTSTGEIYINQIGTNHDNLEDFLEQVKEENKISLIEERRLIINNLPAILWGKTDERLYILYHENTVYTISTKFKSLYTDLDQIAQSFKYNP